MSRADTPPAKASTAPRRLRVGDLLVERGVITAEQIGEALAAQKQADGQKLLGEVIVDLGFATEEQVLETLADGYGVPFCRLNAARWDPAIAEVLPEEFIEKNLVLPMFVVRDKLTLAASEPANVFLFEEIERLTSLKVQVVAATAKNIRDAAESLRKLDTDLVIDELVGGVGEDDLALVEREIADLSDSVATGDDSPVIKLVNAIILSAVQEAASDIHIEPDEGALRIRYRIDGRLYEKMRPPHNMAPAIASRIKIMASLDISERRIPQDGGITVQVSKRKVDLRVSTIPGKFGEKVVMRVIDKKDDVLTLDALNFPPNLLTKWRDLIAKPNGILLVTGPTGSGKSTTLYATLDEINEDSINISTVEDPVEYNLKGVNQFQTNNKAGFTFASALRSLLRQDPDVVMVGEIRDAETGKTAVQAALTGHLVFSTLHTNDAPSAVTRLFNIGVEPYLVAASVQGVLAQRLVRRLCPHCKEAAPVDERVAAAWNRARPDLELPDTVMTPVGCAKCRDLGFKGRVGLYELFTPDAAALDAVSRGATLQEVRKLAGADSYCTLLDDGIDKIRQGVTTIEELLAVAAG